jgi:DNA repair protein RecO
VFLKTDSIVISRRPVMNTSYVIRCYTERAGRVTALAKGAARKRRKDEPPSIPDLFQRGEVVLWFGRRQDYAILGEWTLDEMRRGVRDDYDAFRAASGCAAVVDELARDASGPSEFFPLLEEALQALDGGAPPRMVVWGFCFRALCMAGFVAPFTSCASCGREGKPGGRAVLAPSGGGLICTRCASAEPAEHELRLKMGPDAVATARYLISTPLASSGTLRASPECASTLDRAARMLAEYHLERPMGILSPEVPLS